MLRSLPQPSNCEGLSRGRRGLQPSKKAMDGPHHSSQLLILSLGRVCETLRIVYSCLRRVRQWCQGGRSLLAMDDRRNVSAGEIVLHEVAGSRRVLHQPCPGAGQLDLRSTKYRWWGVRKLRAGRSEATGRFRRKMLETIQLIHVIFISC